MTRDESIEMGDQRKLAGDRSSDLPVIVLLLLVSVCSLGLALLGARDEARNLRSDEIEMGGVARKLLSGGLDPHKAVKGMSSGKEFLKYSLEIVAGELLITGPAELIDVTVEGSL